MNVVDVVGEGLEYGRKLVDSAIEGAREAGHVAMEDGELPKVLQKAAPSAISLMLAGVGIGVAASYLGNKRKLSLEGVAFGTLGGIAGLLIGLGWSTRHITGGVACGALKGVQTVRDEHWLQRHPIDYA